MAGVGGDAVGDVVEEGVHDLRVVVHHLLGLEAVLVGLALDAVGREGEGRPHETEERGLALGLLLQCGEGFTDEGGGLVRVIDGRELLDLVHRADRRLDDGPGALDDVKLDAHRGEGGEDVGKHDDAVGAKRAEGLHRQLDCNLGRLGPHAEGVLVGIGLELLHVPPRLPHEPHGRPFGLLPLCDPQQNIVGVSLDLASLFSRSWRPHA
mmetsp:Transcript_10303/g.26700  ORF Transcript_10303/g.26700 Transcript_10303/m.26700 type:complete len:209 (+) Transcript_10303:608-1234(+)